MFNIFEIRNYEIKEVMFFLFYKLFIFEETVEERVHNMYM